MDTLETIANNAISVLVLFGAGITFYYVYIARDRESDKKKSGWSNFFSSLGMWFDLALGVAAVFNIIATNTLGVNLLDLVIKIIQGQ